MENVSETGLAPAGFEPQTSFEGFTLNMKRAPFRQPVVSIATLYASMIETKGGAKKRLSLASNPEQHSRPMWGFLCSGVAEGFWLYQCAPDGVDPITWTLTQLVEQLSKHEVVVREYPDKESGEQVRIRGIVSDDGVKKIVEHLRKALRHAEAVQKGVEARARAVKHEEYLARQAKRDAEAASRADRLKAELGLV
ncbi:MAG: hypothetical protein ABIP74_04500 [Candidatus Saccharimonas sp.]